MIFFEKLKQRIILKKIRKLEAKRQKSFTHIKENQKVAIITNEQRSGVKYFAEKFITELKNKQINISEINYLNKKINRKQILPNNVINLYNKKYQKSDYFIKFKAEKYDILILATDKENINVHYLVSQIPAQLRISPKFPTFTLADLSFMIQKDKNCEDYFDAIKKYLVKK